ncbi:MAG TPA: hypothetical protein VJ011_07040, partial [Steroidobacteraceae bacterium]|nr:hypothetical protein [Steroidobacteraceae bacterium]
VFNGKKVSYLATVSETVLDDGAGTATARFFSTSYVRESERGRDARPVLFLFNGGPGAASIWLHFGAFGPKRVALPEDITA